VSGRRVVVTGVGLISALGDSSEALHDALCAGRRALVPLAEVAAATGLPPVPGAPVVDFEPRRYLGDRNLRPLDRTGLLTAAAAERALAAAGWDAERRAFVEVALVLGTTFGSVHTISEFDRRALTAGPAYVKPFDFANSVINAAAGQAAIWHGLRGVNTTLAGGPAVGLEAVAYAADLVASGRSPVALAGGADELCAESVLGYARAGRVAGGDGAEPCSVPFASGRNGFAPGEGAALLVLEDAAAAARRGVAALAVVAGHGSAFDPGRGLDAAASTAAVARAVREALADAGIGAEQIGGVATSAAGSPEGDRREARGIAAALGPTAAAVPVTALKGALGEPLGAGGALQVAALVAALGDGRLPGVAGLADPEPGLGLGRLAAEPRDLVGRHVLATALDHDGGARALVLVRPEEG
jgi:3-oxoacyl-[acyl-carrier-protein] synthase II